MRGGSDVEGRYKGGFLVGRGGAGGGGAGRHGKRNGDKEEQGRCARGAGQKRGQKGRGSVRRE